MVLIAPHIDIISINLLQNRILIHNCHIFIFQTWFNGWAWNGWGPRVIRSALLLYVRSRVGSSRIFSELEKNYFSNSNSNRNLEFLEPERVRPNSDRNVTRERVLHLVNLKPDHFISIYSGLPGSDGYQGRKGEPGDFPPFDIVYNLYR